MLIYFPCDCCGLKIRFEVEPFRPGHVTGEPGACYPDEGGDVEGPDKCPDCGEPVNTDDVFREFERQT